MRRIRLAVLIVASGSGWLGGTPPLAVAAQTPASVADETVPTEVAAKEKARAAEARWLALVDAAKWSDSWKEASTAFRKAVPEQKWETGVDGVRRPLGKVLHRELGSEAYSTSLPGVPDGQYVVSQYRTSFERKADAGETVVVQLDGDGSWRISGYYVR